MVSWVQRGGPLAEFADGYRNELVCRGFTANSVVTHVVLMGQLSRWMAEARVTVEDLGPARFEEFFDSRRVSGQRRVPSARVLDPLLAHLRAIGVAGPPLAAPATPLGDLLERYERHLVEDRGLAASTVVGYIAVARRFLSERSSATGDETGVAGLCGGVVTAFLLRECERLAVGSAKNRVTGLRSLLRFLHLECLVATDLAVAVPPVAGWRDTRLPAMPAGLDVSALVAGCDPSQPAGLRDHAILLLLARLGLRSCEVTRLELGDLDWRAGLLRVRGKGGGEARLPLLPDVGEAIAAYLRDGRPQAESRAVFLTLLAPVRPLRPCSVGHAVARGCERTGQRPVGPHRLRHALAGDMLRRGAALPEIGQVLRHRDLASTAVYAKVDLAALRSVARCWPGAQR
ncbi:MAG TPA: tyrosine-type recombinase/integrase [Streptosporangiaceae bacterium]|nr:tyrosine-type recombinase/integrase [Streptosporangiaceae bacterium]